MMGVNCSNLTYPHPNLTLYVWQVLGPRCVESNIAILTLMLYGVILLLGTVGNLCTCLVIVRNKCMHTATNYYLFSLAVSDCLMLSLGLPFELYSSLDYQYPYRFPPLICKGRAFLIELTSYASILTITAFSAERWLAICFPLKVQLFSKFSRAVKVIAAVWALAFASAMPIAIIVKINRLRFPPGLDWPELLEAASDNNFTIRWTDFCSLDFYDRETASTVINWSFWAFFVAPLTVITVLYAHIAFKINAASDYLKQQGSQCVSKAEQRNIATRRSLLRMLVAVVVAFFVCWLPFHAQRMMVVYLDLENVDMTTQQLYSMFFYVSGYCYYANSAVNPIIYNILSKKFRHTFIRTVCPKRLVRRLGILSTTTGAYRDGSLKTPTPMALRETRVTRSSNRMPSTHVHFADRDSLITNGGESRVSRQTEF